MKFGVLCGIVKLKLLPFIHNPLVRFCTPTWIVLIATKPPEVPGIVGKEVIGVRLFKGRVIVAVGAMVLYVIVTPTPTGAVEAPNSALPALSTARLTIR